MATILQMVVDAADKSAATLVRDNGKEIGEVIAASFIEHLQAAVEGLIDN